MLRVILDSHPHIACGPESSLLTGGFLPHKLTRRFEVPEEEIWRLHAVARDHAHFVELFLSDYARQRGKQRWAEKTPQNVRHLEYIFRWFPRAKFIHVLRDGRDVVSSIRTHPRFRVIDGQQVPTNIRRPLRPCIKCWLADTAAGMRWRGRANYLEIRYEDLLAEPEAMTRKLCEFIGEPWSPALLEYHKQTGTSRDPQHFITNIAATEPLTTRAVARWRKDLTEGEQKLFYQMAGGRLEELGYSIESAAGEDEKSIVASERSAK